MCKLHETLAATILIETWFMENTLDMLYLSISRSFDMNDKNHCIRLCRNSFLRWNEKVLGITDKCKTKRPLEMFYLEKY